MYNNPLNMLPQGSGMGMDPSMFGLQQRSGGGMPGRPMGLTMDSVYGRKNQNSRQYKDFNTSLFKTELCRSFIQTGRCTYGARCQFSHGKQDLRPVVRHRKYKTDKCRNFLNGYCPYGNRCCFLHSESPEMLSKLGVNVNGVKVTINDQAPDMNPIVNNMKMGQVHGQGQMGMGMQQNMRGRIGVPGNSMGNGPGVGGMMNGLNAENLNGQDMSFMLAQHHQLMAQYYTSQAAASASMGHDRANMSNMDNMGNMQMQNLMAQLAHMQLRADAAGLDVPQMDPNLAGLMSMNAMTQKSMEQEPKQTPAFNVNANYAPPQSLIQKIADDNAKLQAQNGVATTEETPTSGGSGPGPSQGIQGSPNRGPQSPEKKPADTPGEQQKVGTETADENTRTQAEEENAAIDNGQIDNLFAADTYNPGISQGGGGRKGQVRQPEVSLKNNYQDNLNPDVVTSSIKMLGLDDG